MKFLGLNFKYKPKAILEEVNLDIIIYCNYYYIFRVFRSLNKFYFFIQFQRFQLNAK